MDKFLETQKLPKLTKEQIEILSRHMTSKKDWIDKKKSPTKKIPGFTNKFDKIFKELTPILLKVFQKKREVEGALPNHFIRPLLS